MKALEVAICGVIALAFLDRMARPCCNPDVFMSKRVRQRNDLAESVLREVLPLIHNEVVILDHPTICNTRACIRRSLSPTGKMRHYDEAMTRREVGAEGHCNAIGIRDATFLVIYCSVDLHKDEDDEGTDKEEDEQEFALIPGMLGHDRSYYPE